jgi:hypothetical protein
MLVTRIATKTFYIATLAHAGASRDGIRYVPIRFSAQPAYLVRFGGGLEQFSQFG